MKNGMVLWMVGDSVLFPGGNKEASVARRIAGAPGLGHKCRSIQVFASPGITSADGRAVFRDLILPNLTRGDSLVVSLGLNDAVRRTRTPHLKRRVWLRWKKLPSVQPDTGEQAVPLKEYVENLRYILSEARRRGVKSCLLLPPRPRWVPRGQGFPTSEWFIRAAPFNGLPPPRQYTHVMDEIFSSVRNLVNAGRTESAVALLSAVSRSSGLSKRAREAVANNHAVLFAIQGNPDAALAELDRVEDGAGHPMLLQTRAWILHSRGLAAQQELDRALDYDEHLPRLPRLYADGAAETARDLGVSICDLDKIVPLHDVLDHCHLTEEGAQLAGDAILADLFQSEEQPASRQPPVKWVYPRIGYARRPGSLSQSYGASTKPLPIGQVATPIQKLLLSHPGVLSELDLPSTAFPHEVEQVPEVLWEATFQPLDHAIHGMSGSKTRSIACPFDLDFFQAVSPSERGARQQPRRVGDSASSLAIRLSSYLSVSTVFSCRIKDRVCTMRNWYPHEALLFGACSSWMGLLERLDLRVVAQAILRLATFTLHVNDSGIQTAGRSLVQRLENLLEKHHDCIRESIPIVTGTRPLDELTDYSESVSCFLEPMLADISTIASMGETIDDTRNSYCPEAVTTDSVLRSLQMVRRSRRSPLRTGDRGESRMVEVTDSMYPLW